MIQPYNTRKEYRAAILSLLFSYPFMGPIQIRFTQLFFGRRNPNPASSIYSNVFGRHPSRNLQSDIEILARRNRAFKLIQPENNRTPLYS